MQSMQSPRLVAVGPIGPDMANAAILQGPYPFMGSPQQMQQIFQGQGMQFPPGMQMKGNGNGGGGTRSGVCASRHMAAEQRRRARINERLEALRSLVPHSARANTAAFLEEVYDYITALHKQLERLGAGPFATPGPSPPTAMLDPPAKAAHVNSQLTGNKRDRSASEESDMQAGLEDLSGAKSQFAPYLQAAMMPGSPLFGATTAPMGIPEMSLRTMMVAPGQQGTMMAAPGQQGTMMAAPGQQATMMAAPGQQGTIMSAPGQQVMLGPHVVGIGSVAENGVQQGAASPGGGEQGLAQAPPQAGEKTAQGSSGELPLESIPVEHESEVSAELEGPDGVGVGQEEAAPEEGMAQPRKRAKKSGPTVEMCGMKARNVQGVHRPIPMKPQA